MPVKISVIIPIYNMEKYLRDCLNSVLRQSLRDIEVICVNDGSQDNSEAILKDFQASDDRIKLFSHENAGVGYSRNVGITDASGEFVAFIDPDDWYPDDDILEALYNSAKRNDVLICGGSFSDRNENGKVKTKYSGTLKKFTFDRDEILSYADYQFDYGYYRFIYKADFLRENNIYFPNYIRFQDPPFFVNAMIRAEKFYAMQKITYCLRVGHKTVNWTERHLSDMLRGVGDILKLSGDEKLSELHALELEHLAEDEFLKLFAKQIDGASDDFLNLFCDVLNCVDKGLIVNDRRAMKNFKALSRLAKCAERRKTCSEQEFGEKSFLSYAAQFLRKSLHIKF